MHAVSERYSIVNFLSTSRHVHELIHDEATNVDLSPLWLVGGVFVLPSQILNPFSQQSCLPLRSSLMQAAVLLDRFPHSSLCFPILFDCYKVHLCLSAERLERSGGAWMLHMMWENRAHREPREKLARDLLLLA